MPLDCARAQEQAAADLPIRETVFDELRDLLLLSSELQRRGIDVPARSSPRGRRQLTTCALGKGTNSHLAHRIMRDLQLIARVPSSISAAQPFAVEEVGPRKCNPQR